MSQKSKFDYSYVYNYIKENNCELLSKEYKNMKQKLLLLCNCGEVFEITFNDFKFNKIHHCKKCTNKLKSLAKSIKYDYVKSYVESKGCKLISTEVHNAHEKIIFQCKCGEIFVRSFNKFKNGQTNCLKCSNKTKWNYEKVCNYVYENSNSELISNEYINENTDMVFLCECGNEFKTSFSSFLHKNKRHCDNCGNKMRRKKLRVGIEVLKNRVANISDCQLLSNTYENYYSILNFKCKCGEHFKTSYMCFIHGKRQCNKCSSHSKLESLTEKFLKENNIKYLAQYTFNDLKGVNNGLLRFDFKIKLEKEKYILLELDGEQHEKPMGFKNGEEKFAITKEHDMRKNKYCKKSNIRLYRISYRDIDNLENILKALLYRQDNPVPSL